ELESAIGAVFSKAADEMAAAAIPGIERLQKVGEGAFETLVRLARTYQVVDIALQSIGKTFGLVGVASLEARQRLVDLVGGLEEFQELTNSFAENFLTEAQRTAPIIDATTKEMERLGLSSIITKEAFAAVVQGIDVTTEAGAELYAALLRVGPAFAKANDFLMEMARNAERLST